MVTIYFFTLLCLTSFSSILAPTAQSDAQFHIDETVSDFDANATIGSQHKELPAIINVTGFAFGALAGGPALLFILKTITIVIHFSDAAFCGLIVLPIIFILWYNLSHQRSLIGYFLNGTAFAYAIMTGLGSLLLISLISGHPYAIFVVLAMASTGVSGSSLLLIALSLSFFLSPILLIGSFINYCFKDSSKKKPIKVPKIPGRNQKKRLLSHYRTVEV